MEREERAGERGRDEKGELGKERLGQGQQAQMDKAGLDRTCTADAAGAAKGRPSWARLGQERLAGQERRSATAKWEKTKERAGASGKNSGNREKEGWA